MMFNVGFQEYKQSVLREDAYNRTDLCTTLGSAAHWGAQVLFVIVSILIQ